jgi:Predicted membrane protein
MWRRIKDFAQLREDTDYEATIETISKGVEFRGMNMWILVFAIIVASVGLNVNSTAVIIGAMLISPLMGPICGIGFSVGIMDEHLLQKSVKNLGIMVLVSLLASFLYFLLSPLGDAQSELLARTRPTIFDVFIAFFGGLAGIVATSRKSQSITVISGVAIATALMPPLCTAGYGLATAQFKYFFGAFYLFFLNSFFIALATFVMVRFLSFPQIQYVDHARNRAVKRIITVFTVIVLVPSIILAIDVVRQAAFNSQAIKFVNETQESELFENIQIVNSIREYHAKEQSVTLSLVGRPLTNSEITELQKSLQNQYGLTHTKLIVKQTGEAIDITKQNEIIEDIINKKDLQISRQDSIIEQLQGQLSAARTAETLSEQLAKEVYVQYPGIREFAITEMTQVNTITLENHVTPIVYIQWKDGKTNSAAEQKIAAWLKVRLNVDEIKVIH